MQESFPYGNTTVIMIFSYDDQGKPFSLQYSYDGGSTFSQYYYAINAQGDVEGIFFTRKNTTTGKQEIHWMGHYTYDAWGNIISIIAPNGTAVTNPTHLLIRNPLRYRGYYYDTETGFYYLQSRYYDPANHRFINADEAEYSTMSAYSTNDTNLFAYCGNNPVIRVDDGGQFWNVVVGAVIGAVVNTVVSYATAKITGEEFTLADAATAFVGGAITGAFAATGFGKVAQAAVSGAVSFGSSVATDALKGNTISWKSAAINGAAGFVGGLIGGDGIRKAGGKLDVAKKALDHASALKKSGAKMIRNTVSKNLKKAAANYDKVYAIESLITLGRYYAGAWGAAILSKGGSQLLEN